MTREIGAIYSRAHSNDRPSVIPSELYECEIALRFPHFRYTLWQVAADSTDERLAQMIRPPPEG